MNLRWILVTLAVLILSAVGLYQVYQMSVSELQVVIPEGSENPEDMKSMLAGLMTYFQGFGLALLLGGIAYVMIGYKEDVTTTPPSQK